MLDTKLAEFIANAAQSKNRRFLLDTDRGVLQLESHTRTDEVYNLTLKFTKFVAMDQPESLQILNLILRRATTGLNLELVGRNYYDPAAKVFC